MYFALLLASALSLHGYRRKSLTLSGALTAFVVGSVMMTETVFGASLLGMYVVGTTATKYGKKRKSMLEEETGTRTGWQVLSNSCWALAACVAWKYTGRTNEMLVRVNLAHFACCLGDTLASELGMLAPSRPRLVTTWRAVPPGTNGAVSLAGTAASAVGGAIMGLIVAGFGYGGANTLLWGVFYGVYGSLVDSLLGATVQQTRMAGGRIVSGTGTATNGADFLSNNAVNVLSSAVCALTSVLV